MAQGRMQRVAEEIKKELGSIISEEIRDPRIGFITLTKVDLTRDLRIARVYFSLLGSKKQLRDTQVGLLRSAKYMRRLLAERMNLRFVPEVTFKLDPNIEYSIHISEVLDKIKDKDKIDESEKDS